MKHFLRFGTVVVALAVSFSLTAFANTKDEITMGSIQNDLLEYLEVNHPEIEFGSKEYIEYVTNVALTNSDKELEKQENYDDIKFYCGEYLHELSEQQTKENLRPDDIFIPSEEFDSTTVGEIERRAHEQQILDEIQYQEIQSQRPAVIKSGYDVDAATSYAKKYATRFNPFYNAHSKDCTNFVSQCLYAGGISMESPRDIPLGIYDTTKYWYSEPTGATWRESTSWINVDDLYTYCIKEANAERHEYASLSALKQGVQVGDVVQIGNRSGEWYHSIFISDYSSKDGYLYCAHSSFADDKPISGLAENNKYRVIRF